MNYLCRKFDTWIIVDVNYVFDWQFHMGELLNLLKASKSSFFYSSINIFVAMLRFLCKLCNSCYFSRLVTNSKHGTRFLFLRGPILTIEVLNLDKGKCIFELNPTYAYLTRSTLKKIGHPCKLINTSDLNLI